MVNLIPDRVEWEVVAALFADAERLNWEILNSRERSKQYQAWLISPRVGGRLTTFMSSDAARVWIKDGPMKEFARALNGLGKYAALVEATRPSPVQIVQLALGASWAVVEGTQRIKPLSIGVREHEDDHMLTFAWGPARDLKHLVWAALSGAAEPADWILCVIAPAIAATPRNVQLDHARIAARSGLRVVHLHV